MKFFILLISIWTFQVCSSFPLAGDLTPAKEGQYKEHGLVRLGRGEKYPICEGVVMDENYFLTVAGCVHKYVNSLGDLEVVVGTISTETIDSNKNAQTRKISSIEFPPQWADSGKKYGDLALIKVSQPFTFNDVVGAIGSFTYEAAENEAGKIIGYGSDEDLSSFPVKIQSERQCKEKFGIMSPGTFCVLTKTEEVFNNQDYSGAPCADQKESDRNIYGIYAYEESGVFTSLLFYRDWIERFLGPSKTTKAPSTSSTSGDVTDSPSTSPASPQNSTTDEPSTTTPLPSTTTTQAATTAASSTAVTPAQTTATTSSSAAPTQTTVTSTTYSPTTAESDEDTTENSESEESEETTTSSPTPTESDETTEDSESNESKETTTSSPTPTEPDETDETDSDESEETTTPSPTTTEAEETSDSDSEESEESTTTKNTKNDNNDFYDDNDKQSMNGQSDDSASNQDSKAQPEVELSQSSVTRNSAQLRQAALPSITNLVSKVGSSFSSIKETISSLIS